MNKNIPKRRFKGFKDDWEQRKLEDLGDISTGNTPSTSNKSYWSDKQDEGHVWITPTDIESLYMHNSERKLTDDGWAKARRLPENSVLITSIASIGKNAINTVPAAFNQQINAIVPEDNNPDFILYSMIRNINRFAALAGQTATAIINKSTFEKFTINVTNIKEQEQIGLFFKELDNLITLHQRKLEKTMALKDAYVEKMFPQNKDIKPEYRFKGFTDAWEQCKLEQIINVGSGRDYKLLSEGNIPVYGTGGYMLSVNEALSYDKDAIGIGRKGTIDNPFILKAPFWTVDTLFYVTPNDNYNLNFIFNIFRNINWQRLDESTGVPSLSKTTINSIHIKSPDLSEQEKIGSFFKELDNLITLHQRKLEKLKNLKQAYLNEMFVD